MENKIKNFYKKLPTNGADELHIAYRCSDSYAIYAPISIYSILHNNQNAYTYIYIFTDHISEERWNKILTITKNFTNCEIIKIVPDLEDIIVLKKNSKVYHGWDLIHISIFYQKY